MQRLIDAGWDLDEVDAMGHTPLHVAAGSEEPDSGALSFHVSAHSACRDSIMIVCLSQSPDKLLVRTRSVNDFSPCREQRLCPNSLIGVIVVAINTQVVNTLVRLCEPVI
jgi:hypothetical protein